jgi:hypothetical protein
LEFPPKYRLRNMTTDEGNVRLRQQELQVYFERLLGVSLCRVYGTGISTSNITTEWRYWNDLVSECVLRYCVLQEAGLLAVPEVRDSLGLSQATCTKVAHLLDGT